MRTRARAIALTSLLAAIAVFLVVQDRITAGAARDYVMHQRAAAAGQGPPVTVDDVMRPAVARSVRVGLLWGGAVLAAGLALAFSARRWPGGRAEDRGPSRR